jgi:hypothetical protein
MFVHKIGSHGQKHQRIGSNHRLPFAVLEAIGSRRIDAAMAASEALTDFVSEMFDAMQRELDPALLVVGPSIFG